VRITTGLVLWLVAAAAATAVGLAAVAAIGTDIFGGGRDPLTQSEVDNLLASRTSVPPASATSSSTTAPTSSSPQPAEERSAVTAGGTVISRCTAGGLVEVLTATPAQGYQVDSADDGPEDHPSVRFTSGETEIEVRLRCAGGVPVPEVKADD
jgi:hypothetical protein